MSKNIFFLYSELSEYTVECLNFIVKNNRFKIYVFSWPVNDEAPFKFNISKEIIIGDPNFLYEKSMEVKPEIIFCSGWLDKSYIKLIKSIDYKCTKVLMIDNYWKDSIKQILGRNVLKSVTKNFDLSWVPSNFHVSYSQKIGFKNKNIILGLYARDLSLFNDAFHNNKIKKSKNPPKKFIYVGRYLKLKGILDLWNAFKIFSKTNSEWELHCVGTGYLSDKKMIHPKIFHHGFLSRDQIIELSSNTGIFVMPSHSDHWGMAVQEFACLGFPLICSNKVGSSYSFLEEGKNGFHFESKNINDLVRVMNKFSVMNNKELYKFAQRSNELSFLYNLETWNNTILNITKFYD